MLPNLQNLQQDDPELWAMTMAELARIAREDDPAVLERRQAEFAAAEGNLAREFAGGHSVARVLPEIADAWIRKVGPKAFVHDVLPYLAKHHPSTAMKYQPANLTLRVHGRRGRWAA